MPSEPLPNSQLAQIMLKFRPIAPKPPPTLAALPFAAGPTKSRRTSRQRKPKKKKKKITTTKAAAAAVISPPPTAAETGEEIERRLEADASPCFSSDSAGRVAWANAAFRRMALSCGESPAASTSASAGAEMATRGVGPGGGFTCVARVRRGRVEMVVPCDVWRVGEGKWAWRLDVATALGLGLCCE